MITPKRAVCSLYVATVSFIYSSSTTDSTTFFVASQSTTTTTTTSSSSTSTTTAGKLRSLGEVAMSERRFDDAVSYYQQAIELEPTNAANYYKLFRVHSRMRSYASALEDITQACEILKSTSEGGGGGDEKAMKLEREYRVQKAKLLVNLGQCEEAMEEYNIMSHNISDIRDMDSDIIKQRDEAHNCAYFLKSATTAHANQNWDVAVKDFTSLLSIIDQNYDFLFMKAQAEYQLGDYYGTISDTGKILKAYSKHIEAYELRGKAYFRLGEHDTAIQHYREGLKLDPEHKGCKADHKAIKALLKKEKRGDDAVKAGKHEDAVSYWLEAIALDETHRAFARPTLLKIVKSLSKLGKHDQAVEVAKKHIQEEETLEGLFVLGDAQLDAELFDQAVQTFREALEFEVSSDEFLIFCCCCPFRCSSLFELRLL